MIPISGISGVAGVSGISGVSGSPETRIGGAPSVQGVGADADVGELNQKKRLGVVECETCANRTYQDGSDDPGVSFKAPTKLSPNVAASAVPAHEREHFNREQAKADEEGKEVLSNSIRIHTSICNECGRTYVSGGVTTTVTRGKGEEKSQEEEAMKKLFGIDEGKGDDSVKGIGLKIANAAYGLNFDKKH